MKNNNIKEIFIAIVMMIGWFITYSLIRESKEYLIAENIFLVLLATFIFVHLILFKNTYIPLVLIMFLPFSFAHSFDGYSIPSFLVVFAIIVLLGMFIHLIRFKCKLKPPMLIGGFIAICLSLLLGGLGSKNNYLPAQFILVAILCFALLFVLVFFTSTISKVPFDKIVFLMCVFSTFIQMQAYIAMFISANFDLELLNGRSVNVGWGICNNIGVILLLTLPFSLYYIINKKHEVFGCIFPLLTLTSIYVFLSKGSAIIGTIGLLILYIVLAIRFYIKKQYKQFTILLTSSVAYLSVLFVLFFIIDSKTNIILYIINNFKEVDLSSLNGRIEIYKNAISDLNGYYVFGKGIFAGYIYDDLGVTNGYIWCHSTLIQALYSGGIVGLSAMIYHLLEKYLYLFKKTNSKKMIVFCGYLFSGIYGLFDVSYFFINYMILFLVIVILTNHLF